MERGERQGDDERPGDAEHHPPEHSFGRVQPFTPGTIRRRDAIEGGPRRVAEQDEGGSLLNHRGRSLTRPPPSSIVPWAPRWTSMASGSAARELTAAS